MSKKKMKDVVAYVHGISPSKRNFNVKLQTSGNENNQWPKQFVLTRQRGTC